MTARYASVSKTYAKIIRCPQTRCELWLLENPTGQRGPGKDKLYNAHGYLLVQKNDFWVNECVLKFQRDLESMQIIVFWLRCRICLDEVLILITSVGEHVSQ